MDPRIGCDSKPEFARSAQRTVRPIRASGGTDGNRSRAEARGHVTLVRAHWCSFDYAFDSGARAVGGATNAA